MRFSHAGSAEVLRAVSEPLLFNSEPRMDTNKHECKRIAADAESELAVGSGRFEER